MSQTTDRSVWIRWLLMVFLAPPAAYFSYTCGVLLGPTPRATNTPNVAPSPTRLANGLEIDPADLNIGEVWEDPEFIRPVTITNRGDREVRVTDMTGGCECTSIEPQTFALGPDQSREVRVKIDLTHRMPHQFGVDRRELAVTIFPQTQDRGMAADMWKVTGVINSRVSLDGRGLAYLDRCSQGGPPVPRKMRATAHIPLAKLEAEVEAGKGIVRVIPVSNEPGKFDIAVTPDTNLPLGPFRFNVALTAVAPDGTKSRCAPFSVAGEMVLPVQSLPNPVQVGEHPVGSKVVAFLTLQFLVPGWTVERVECGSPATEITSTPQLDGRMNYRLVQLIQNPGDQISQVRFTVRKPTNELETLSVPVQYHGELQRQEGHP